MPKNFFHYIAALLACMTLLNGCTTIAADGQSVPSSGSSSETAISQEPLSDGQIIPLTRKDLDEMGKGEFEVKLSMSPGEFPVDPNDFRPPSVGHQDTIKEGMIPKVEEPSPWNFGDLPIYYANVVWYPLECLTGAYFFEVYYIQDTDVYVYRHSDLSEYKEKSFYDDILRDNFDPFTYGIPVFYFQVFRRSDFEAPGAWIDAAGKRVEASSLPVWYQDEDIVAADMTGYTFPEGYQAFLEEYQEQKADWYKKDGYDYTWLVKRNELWRRPPEAIFIQ